ncbi:MAG: YdcH family protein [Pseudomonadota bacterium]
MSLDARLSQLQMKHEALSRQIESEQRHPATDALTIAQMKRQKLQLKDEIKRISPS